MLVFFLSKSYTYVTAEVMVNEVDDLVKSKKKAPSIILFQSFRLKWKCTNLIAENNATRTETQHT